MVAIKKISIITIVAVIASAALALPERPMFNQPPKPQAQPQQEFPFVGKVTGQDVYVRSGPGTAYYFSDKVSQPTEITVVGVIHDLWYKILPTEGTFSWISAEYVKVDPTNPDRGIVTADSVRVYAGSEHIKPQHSSSFQTRLNEGDNVKLVGPITDGYYKIQPPQGAYYYIAKSYVDFVRSLAPQKEEPADETNDNEIAESGPADQTETEPADETEQAQQNQQDQVAAEGDEAAEEEAAAQDEDKISTERTYILEVREIAAEIDEIHKNPLSEQDYSGPEEQLQAIAANPEAGGAQEYAKYLLGRIANFKLAIKAGQAVEDQEKQLQRKLEQIRAEHQKKLESIPHADQFVATGTLKKSAVFTAETGQQRYLVVGDNKKIIAYAVPTSRTDLSNFVGRKVGLIGELVPVQGQSIPLIRFTELKLIEAPQTPESTE